MRRDANACAVCGAKNHAGWRTCQRCGRALTAAPAVLQPASGRSTRLPWVLAGAIGLGILALVVLPSRAPDPGEPLSRPPIEAAQGPAQAGAPPEAGAGAAAEDQVARTPVTRDDFARAGEAAYAQGSLTVALSAFESAAAAYPDDPDARSNLGQLLIRLGRTAEAVPHLEAAVAADPSRWAFRFNLARARGVAGDWDGAVADYRVALDLFPDDHATLFNLGRGLQKAGRHGEAVLPLERAVALQPADASSLLLLAASYEQLGRGPDATQAYRTFLDRHPAAAEAAAVRARLGQLDQVSRPSAGSTVAAPAPPAG